jgi:hypothetical protein
VKVKETLPLYVVMVRYTWPTDWDDGVIVGPMWDAPNRKFPPDLDDDEEQDEGAVENWKGDWSHFEAWQPLRAFADRAKAEAFAQKQEEKIRPKCNPFQFGSKVKDWSNFEEPQLIDWLMDFELELPKPKKRGKAIPVNAWRKWWHDNAKTMTALQRSKVWEALDKVRFHRVEELKE